MAGRRISRRRFLTQVLLGTTALLAPVAFARTISKESPWLPGRAETPPAYPTNRFLTAAERRGVNAITARLTPTDDIGAGARVTGGTDSIDSQLAGFYGRGERWYMRGPFAEGLEIDEPVTKEKTMITKIVAFTAAIMLSGNALAQNAAEDAATAKANFVDREGNASGNGELSAVASGGVLIKLEITGLPAGEWVAFHVHETGSCDHTTGHESAGGHFNPGSKEHGYMAANGPHAGDMPNQYVGEDRALRAEILNGMVTLDEEDTSIMGRALMVHAKADDYRSQPSGDAGDRLACGVIE